MRGNSAGSTGYIHRKSLRNRSSTYRILMKKLFLFLKCDFALEVPIWGNLAGGVNYKHGTHIVLNLVHY